MDLRPRAAGGVEYLQLATETLHSVRLAHPTAEVWEAADLQWWWRKSRHEDPDRQTFWMRDDGPAAAVIVTDWGNRFSCDLLMPEDDQQTFLDRSTPDLVNIDGATQSLEEFWADSSAILVESSLASGGGL